MIKHYFSCFLVAITSLFFNISDSFATISTVKLNNIQMPQYTATFTLPPASSTQQTATLVLRYYQAFGDSSRTGWQTPITLPTVTLNGQILPLNNEFSYNNDSYMYGSYMLGFDQYAQYYYNCSIALSFDQETIVKITGTFQQVAYLSAVIYLSQTQQEILDRQMDVPSFELNPYIYNHPSVFSYSQNLVLNPGNIKSLPIRKINKKLFYPHFLAPTGKINIYRLDQETSTEVVAEDIATDGCSRAYLYAGKNPLQEMIILRVKVPKTFIENDFPDKIFKQYQTRYFSISAHRASLEGILLDFWTINARMLKDYEDTDGYAYIFFAPNEYTQELARQQKTSPTQPPVMTWGHYKGYLLGNPDYAIIMRYRDPDPQWQGSPENAICYATPDLLKPVTNDELGEYLPEIYGDTIENFNNGHIGLVDKNSPWPNAFTKQR